MKHYPADPDSVKVFLGMGFGAVAGVIAGQYLGNTMLFLSAGMAIGGVVGVLAYYFGSRNDPKR